MMMMMIAEPVEANIFIATCQQGDFLGLWIALLKFLCLEHLLSRKTNFSYQQPCVLTKSVVAMEDCESKCVSSVESDVDAGV